MTSPWAAPRRASSVDGFFPHINAICALARTHNAQTHFTLAVVAQCAQPERKRSFNGLCERANPPHGFHTEPAPSAELNCTR